MPRSFLLAMLSIVLFGSTISVIAPVTARATGPQVRTQAPGFYRMKLLADAAEQGILVGGAHISFPGLGHIRADVQGYNWIALPYSADR